MIIADELKKAESDILEALQEGLLAE